MKISTILLIIVLILVLYYYTAETFEVVEIVGKHVYQIVKESVTHFKEPQTTPAPEETVGDSVLEKMAKKIKSVFT